MKYSVIIPVYNAGRFLNACVESVLKQKLQPEIILVDDGSQDNSADICDTYARDHENIKAFHIPNGGAGNARNYGLLKATGEYVIFVDSDDKLSDGFFDLISDNEELENCDIIFFDAVKTYSSGYTEPVAEGLIPEKITGQPKRNVLSHIAGCNKFPASPWGKIVKRSFLIENNIQFLTGVLSEDVDWTIRVLINAQNFGFYRDGKYLYRQNESSQSNNIKNKKKNVADLLFMIEDWVLKSETSEYKAYILQYLAYEYAMIFPFYGFLSGAEQKEFEDKMKKYRYLLSFGATRKLKMIKTAVSILGVKNAAKLLKFYVQKRDNR